MGSWQLMNKPWRLTLVKSVMGSMLMYLVMAGKMLAWVIREIESIPRNFLWTGKDASARGKCAVAWTSPSTDSWRPRSARSSSSWSCYAQDGCGSNGLMAIELELHCS